MAVAREILKRGLTVRDTERLIAGHARRAPRGPRPRAEKTHEIVDTEHELSRLLGVKVAIVPRDGEAGDLTIRYNTLEQFDDLLHRLTEGVMGGKVEEG